ncbi:MAG: hypothetical protein V7K90_28195 [Nostoc sp.]
MMLLDYYLSSTNDRVLPHRRRSHRIPILLDYLDLELEKLNMISK